MVIPISYYSSKHIWCDTPGIPGTTGTPGTPSIPGTPGTPGTFGTPDTPGTPGTPSTYCITLFFHSSYIGADKLRSYK